MKDRTKKAVILTGAALMTVAIFTGCKSNSEDMPNLPDVDSVRTETLETKLQYYESLILDLEKQLLSEKEASYVSAAEYTLRIEELEESIKELSSLVDSLSDSEKAESDVTPPTNTDKDRFPTSLSDKNAFQYEDRNGEITIIGYSGTATDVIIPSAIDSHPVTAIGDNAFKGSSIKTVTLPDSVTDIGWFAFADCKNLQKVKVPSSVTKIGYGAFDSHSSSLTLICPKGSYAESFAASWAIAFLTN